MFVIIVYDVSVERVGKICQFLRQYLNWVQNSVFEGDLTESEMKQVEFGIKEIINLESDSVIIYSMQTEKFINRTIFGIQKVDTSSIV